MQSLNTIFVAYLQMNRPRIKWVFFFFVFFCVLLWALSKLGYAKQYRSEWTKVMIAGLLALAYSFVFVTTLFGRKMGDEYKINLMPFDSYHIALVDGNKEMLLQIIMNIAMYVPLGFLVPCYFKYVTSKKHTICTLLIYTVLTEIIQGITRIGYFELDDIIDNVAGGIVGLISYIVFGQIKRKVKKERSGHKGRGSSYEETCLEDNRMCDKSNV